MELLSPVLFADGRTARVRTASDHLGVQANKLYCWFTDKRRQLSSIAGNDPLIKALLSAEKAPAEGARLLIGSQITVYLLDGSRIRLRICGVRSGGFSNAYSAIDLDEMRAYCLKENRAIPGDEGRKNSDLATEAEISLRLGRYPHLVTTRSAFYHLSRLYILTEYLPDESLDLRLKRTGCTLDDCVAYAIQVCRAMVHARSVLPGFVHGDIKPGNCLIASNGTLKLGDFGLSSADGVGRDRSDARTGESGAAGRPARGWGGTTPYMAPEMFDRYLPDRTNADIYALGVTMFELASGKRPFRHRAKSGLIDMHRSAEPPLDQLREKGAPGPLIELIAGCLSKSQIDRPQSFADIERELLRISEKFGIGTRVKTVGGQVPETDPAPAVLSFAAIKRHATGIKLINAEITAKGRTAELLAAKAIVLADGGSAADAYEASTAALMIGAEKFVVLYAHAKVLIARNDLENAAAYLERAHRLEPGNYAVLNLLGRVCRKSGEYTASAEYLKRSLVLDASQPEALAELSKLDLARGDAQAAVIHSQKALTIDPEHSSANTAAAEAFGRLGSSVESVKAYKNALRTNPCSRDLRRKFLAACAAADAAAGGSTGCRLERLVLQSALFLQKPAPGSAAARRFVKTFIREFTSSGFDPQLLFYCDAALAKAADAGWIADSGRLYDSLKEVHNRYGSREMPFHLQYSLGRVFYSLDEFEDCSAVFTRMLENFGPNESSHYYLGACAEVRGDLAGALDNYTKAARLLDSEESRTGIRRVTSRLDKEGSSSRRSAVTASVQ